MILPKDLVLFSYLIVLTRASFKGPSGAAPWASYASKSAYARALGLPVTGMDTITVPYMSKSPSFPKFVDPKMMISKKTDMLSNLFNGLGPAYPMSFKPFMPYTVSPSLYNTVDKTPLLSKSNMDDEAGQYKRGIFGPFGSKPFGPMASKFGPMPPFSSLNTIPEYSMKDEIFRRKRSIDESPYPTLAPISAMFGPFGPVVDPSMFIAKKTTFLDNLFKNIVTSTPAPSPIEVPTTKSTIVPPDFWLPSSVIPNPTEYNDKVSEFLDKLFDTLKLNKTALTSDDDSANLKNDLVRSIVSDGSHAQIKIARSIEDLSSINAAKDSIVSNILSELGDLKSNMVTTMNDLISYEKSATSLSSKKPFKPFSSGPWAKPTIDGMFSFQQKMGVLSQVFDMLTDLQKNITLAVQNITKARMTSTAAPGGAFSANYPMTDDILSSPSGLPINITLLDAIKHKLNTLDYGVPLAYNPSYSKFGLQMARSLPKDPGSVWVSYPEDAGIKREIVNGAESFLNEGSSQKQQARSVKMQMHQGYQSLPAGSIESVQAGGGSTREHQGGGIKLYDPSDYEDYYKWANWMEYLRNDNRGYRHHNHH